MRILTDSFRTFSIVFTNFITCHYYKIFLDFHTLSRLHLYIGRSAKYVGSCCCNHWAHAAGLPAFRCCLYNMSACFISCPLRETMLLYGRTWDCTGRCVYLACNSVPQNGDYCMRTALQCCNGPRTIVVCLSAYNHGSPSNSIAVWLT